MPAAKKKPARAAGKQAGKPAVRVVAKKAERVEPLSPAPIRLENAKGECQQKLDALGIDGLCRLILEGHSTSRVAREMGISNFAMLDWIAKDPNRSARVREARKESAEADTERAEQVLLEAGTAVEVARARELAAHYRWKAKTSNPARYGDKLEVDSTIKVQELSDGDLDKQIHRLAGALGATAFAAILGATGPASTPGPDGSGA